MSILTDLLTDIEKFCRTAPMTERAFGIAVAGNHKFVGRIRAGHSVYSDTIDRAYALIEGRPMPPAARASSKEAA